MTVRLSLPKLAPILTLIWAMKDADELLHRYNNSERNFPGIVFSPFSDLSCKDLSGANLVVEESTARLTDSDMYRAILGAHRIG